MDATLKLKNKPNIIGAAANFTYHWGINSGLDGVHATRLAVAVSELVTDVVLFAFGEQEGEMEIAFQRHDDRVEVIVHEYGEPFNPDRHRYNRQRALDDGNFTGAGFELVQRLSDEFIYLNKGKQGKEFRLVQHMNTPHITELLPARELSSAADHSEGPQQYVVKPVTIEDAEDISKLIYRTYGHTYHKEKLYFPRQLEVSIEQKEKIGVITRTQQGEPVGYFAVLRTTDSNICEVGEAVVAVKHRRKGLMKMMLRHLIEMARERGLLAAFGEATSAHIISQRVNAQFGFQSVAIVLSISPVMVLSGFEKRASSQDLTSVFDFVLLTDVPPRAVYLPERYQDILLDIYRLLDIEVAALPRITPELADLSDLEVQIAYEDKFGLVIVRQFGHDFEEQFVQVLKDLEDNEIRTIDVDLPLADPATPQHVPLLRRLGFIFCGLMPVFHQEADYFRMQFTTAQLDFDLIHTFSDMGKRLKAIVQKEYYETSTRRKQIVS